MSKRTRERDNRSYYLVPATAPPGIAFQDARGSTYFVTANPAGKPGGARKVPKELLELRDIQIFRPFLLESERIKFQEGEGMRPNRKPRTGHSLRRVNRKGTLLHNKPEGGAHGVQRVRQDPPSE